MVFNQEDYKLLRINLAKQSTKVENVPQEYLERYIGGKGLGTKYLLDEVPAGTDPLGKNSKMFLVNGPLTGTLFPTSNRYGIVYKSPLTGTYAESYSGGNVGRIIRFVGYIVIVIEGVSEKPIFLDISDEKVDFKDASDIWGLDTIETTHKLKGEKDKDVGVICIGQAGENLVRIACLQNDLYHSAGRCGPGAVFGSKKLKAIRFQGKKKTKLDSQPEFRNLVLKNIYKKIKEKPELYGKNGVYRMLGTPSIVDWANELGCFPHRYFTEGFSPKYEKVNDQAVLEILEKRTGCTNCPFGCGKYVEVKEGEFKSVTEGPEYETIALISGNCDIMDINATVKINDYCDRIGVDSISAGNLVGLAIEAIRREIIPPIDGLELDYGKPKEVLKFLEMMVEGKGIAADFALGQKHLIKKFEIKDLAMQVKGLGFAGYDPRQFRGFALSYGVAPEGPTHLRSVYHGIERNLPNRLSYENKVAPMIEQEDKMALLDSFILCKFIRGAVDWEEMVDTYNVIFDRKITVSGLRDIADNIVRGSRIFNVREGFSREDDYMPKRAYKEYIRAPDGSETKLDRKKYGKMLDEYYEQRKWDSEGIPINLSMEKQKSEKKGSCSKPISQ